MSQLNANLVIAISSRALFDLVESHQVFEKEGVEAYCDYQINLEDKPLNEGAAFDLVKKLLAINSLSNNRIKIEVILLSRNSADTGLRVFNSINHHKLDIKRAVFTNGESTFPYVSAFGAHLFLSLDPNDVTKTLEAGYAAATILKVIQILILPIRFVLHLMEMLFYFLMSLNVFSKNKAWMRFKKMSVRQLKHH